MKTAQELGLGKAVYGREWEAGETPPGDSAPGRWTAAKRVRDWAVLFRSAKGIEYVIHTFPMTDSGERAARAMAAKLVEIAWGRSAQTGKAPGIPKKSSPQTN
jgi:hypothetical protein